MGLGGGRLPLGSRGKGLIPLAFRAYPPQSHRPSTNMVLFSLGGRAWDQHGSSAQLPVLALRAGLTVAWPRVPGIQFTRPQGLCASVYVCLLVSVSAGPHVPALSLSLGREREKAAL